MLKKETSLRKKRSIALVPIKNESWILPTFFCALKGIVDEIIVLDDHSTDNSAEIAKKHGATVIKPPLSKESITKPMSTKRQLLLDEGRRHGGTHFVCLDADEAISSNFAAYGKELIFSLIPGQKMYFEWMQLWETPQTYRDDTNLLCGRHKDFAFCDDGSNFPYQFLSEFRTPPQLATNDNRPKDIYIDRKRGVVLHFQFTQMEKVQWKQAWYRCSELLHTNTKAGIINLTYAMTMNTRPRLKKVPNSWINNIVVPKSINANTVKPHSRKGSQYATQIAEKNWHSEQIMHWFDTYGISYFEPLQIWHIKALEAEFIKRTGRMPQPEKVGVLAYRVFELWQLVRQRQFRKLLKYF